MTITESAQKKVDQTLNGEGFLGIHLEGGGCSGYQIKLSPSTDIPQDAEMLSETIFSDPTSLELLGDAKMDWVDDPFKPTFHFTPPTGASSCGCGSSFTFIGGSMEKWKELSPGKKRFYVALGIIVVVAVVGWATGWWSSPEVPVQ